MRLCSGQRAGLEIKPSIGPKRVQTVITYNELPDLLQTSSILKLRISIIMEVLVGAALLFILIGLV